MKTLRIITVMIIASLLSACANLDSLVPPITGQKINYTRTGKFSSTTVEIENLRREGDKIKADKLTVHHSNAWIPNVDIKVEGYERAVKPEENK